ncbi:DUF3054 domain-containing protein [Agreia sp. COWG]|uniref:DUF3054 domain-containing protein n=1 Tax=Agreia sp. COWG TaxID=2773266 RepID=UPI001F3F7BB9|nr:DUF3054 domain-containing protein [Agreia sp. COWG]
MNRPAAASTSIAVAAVADLVLVLVFVLIGRGSHDEGFSIEGSLVTAWPFVVGLAAGWLLAWAWRAPWAVRWAGVVIWASTVVIGVLLRGISGQGLAVSFVIVTTLVLAAFLLGWRAIAGLILRRSSRGASA